MKFIPLLLCLLSLFSTALSAQTIRYINHDASGNGDGSSWANAFIRFQQALAVAQDGDEIWVAKGTYKPTTSNDRYAYFNLPSGIAVYGGFAGTETLREQRDWDLNPTILSGDIGVAGDSTDNSFTVLYSYSPNEKTRLDGLIFEEGNADDTDPATDAHRPTRSGGGIYLDGENFGYAQLSVSNCIFRRNRAQYQGGGIYANGREGGMAIVRLEHCLFERNVSKLFGGAFSLENYFEQPFALEIKDCEFRDNYAFSSGHAIWLRAHQAVTFSDCKFSRNLGVSTGTVFFTQLESNHSVEFSRCWFDKNGNSTIYHYPNFGAINESRFIVKSCVFSENGIPVISFTSDKIAKAIFENCSFIFNKPDNINSFGGFVVSINGVSNNGVSDSIIFTNSLFYKNRSLAIAAASAEIHNSIFIDIDTASFMGIFWGSGPFNVLNSLFRLPSCDLLDGGWFNSLILCDSTNLFGIDPLFVNPSNHDFHLQSCSPAINAGANVILDSLGITTDLDGNPRIRNATVDMGPYETNISLHPTVSAQPACAGFTDGAVEFSPDICPPFNFAWSNGVTTGTNTEGLAAGKYVFSATGSNNVPVSDTIIIGEPSSLEVTAEVKDAHCFGQPSGRIETFVNGGTPPFHYNWNPPLPPVASHYNLLLGTYSVTVTDANGCTHTVQANIGSPDPIQVFYTTQNVSCMGCSDGSIVFDSIIGGTNPLLPASLFNLPIGHYCVTITDAASCTAIACTTVDVISNTSAEPKNLSLKLSPNPTPLGEAALLEWLGSESATLRVLDFQGRILAEKRLGSNASTRLVANWPAGIYQIEIRTISGKRAVQRWAIF